jgi:hypothetical protein
LEVYQGAEDRISKEKEQPLLGVSSVAVKNFFIMLFVKI